MEQPPLARRHARLLRGAGRWLARLLLLAAALTLLLLAVGPHLFGYRAVVMRSASMRPVAGPGDLLIVRAEPVTRVRVGQVLTFVAPLPGQPVLSHRVIAVQHQPGGVFIRTRGDANPTPDPWLAQLHGSTAWHLATVVPAVGHPLALLHRPGVRAISVWLIPALLCVEVLGRVWRRPERDPAGDDAAEDDAARDDEVAADDGATREDPSDAEEAVADVEQPDLVPAPRQPGDSDQTDDESVIDVLAAP